MRATIFVNGTINDYTQLARWLREDDYLIGADGGTHHCLVLGRQPHAVVGDLDSLPPTLVEQLQAQGVQIERHPVQKDETDLELAVNHAVRHGASEILLLGALGGRLDQTIGNVLLLARQDWAIPLVLADGDQVAQVLRGGETLTLAAPIGSTVSLIPLSDQVTGITYSGLTYPLDNATLRLGSTRGVSNVVASLLPTVQIATGLALVIQTLPL
jgi:thiamine pyrophosphokinase